jgi:hypothetical protein
MTSNPTNQSCGRTSCTCEVLAGQTYCGPHCANASTRDFAEAYEAACACGHGQCHGTTARMHLRDALIN